MGRAPSGWDSPALMHMDRVLGGGGADIRSAATVPIHGGSGGVGFSHSTRKTCSGPQVSFLRAAADGSPSVARVIVAPIAPRWRAAGAAAAQRQLPAPPPRRCEERLAPYQGGIISHLVLLRLTRQQRGLLIKDHAKQNYLCVICYFDTGRHRLTLCEMADVEKAGVPAGPHFLESEWVFWEHRVPDKKQSSYEDNMAKLCEMATVEDFWRAWNNIPKPSQLFANGKVKKKFTDRTVESFSLFKKNIKPEWEDPMNRTGAEWFCRKMFPLQQLVRTHSFSERASHQG